MCSRSDHLCCYLAALPIECCKKPDASRFQVLTNQHTFCQWVLVHHLGIQLSFNLKFCMLLLPALGGLAWTCLDIYNTNVAF
jgi:hypothetical protein